MARPRGFEPLASASGGLRSIQLSYGRVALILNRSFSIVHCFLLAGPIRRCQVNAELPTVLLQYPVFYCSEGFPAGQSECMLNHEKTEGIW